MFPAFFDPGVLRNREKTGLGDQILVKSYDIGKMTFDSDYRGPQKIRGEETEHPTSPKAGKQ
jgi:hypothetical protein